PAPDPGPARPQRLPEGPAGDDAQDVDAGEGAALAAPGGVVAVEEGAPGRHVGTGALDGEDAVGDASLAHCGSPPGNRRSCAPRRSRRASQSLRRWLIQVS